MCLLETKVYIHPDGYREITETTRPCSQATSISLCRRVERRRVEEHARVVGRRPRLDQRESDGLIVTEGRDGAQRVYRDITRRYGMRNLNRGRANTSKRSSLETPPPSPTASYFVNRPQAPSAPPPLSPGKYQVPSAMPYMAGEMNEPDETIGPDGTAIYASPPPLDLPRARENERYARIVEPREAHRPSSLEFSVSPHESIPAPSSSSHPRRHSFRVNKSAEESSPSAGSPSSPGLSQLPKVGSARHDSAQDISRPGILRRESQKDHAARLQREEDERQAQLERDRLAESERRQEARRNAQRNAQRTARDASQESRERHRREAAAALEGERQETDRLEKLEAEYAQMECERAAAEQRRRDSDLAAQMYEANEQFRREARAQVYRNRSNPHSSRRMTNESYTPFTSSPLRAQHTVQVRNPPSLLSRNSASMRLRGEDVIAREQARLGEVQRASQRLSAVIYPEDTYAIEDGYELEGYSTGREIFLERRERRHRWETENERIWR
ncbi:hypothetical protein M433DRAFT_198168 [Acidomyces richmondensis BFW]|nr:hypothetical protein M433DRAFT_198168 [Acidomyces richmondensis BFW]